MAKDLEPLEEERAEIEAGLLALDREKLGLERWINEQEALEEAKSDEEKARDQHLDELDSLYEDDIISEEENDEEEKRPGSTAGRGHSPNLEEQCISEPLGTSLQSRLVPSGSLTDWTMSRLDRDIVPTTQLQTSQTR